MNYLVIDLEMCRVPKHYRSKTYKYAHEIIQVGAVLLDEAYEVIGRINQYVHPEHGVMRYVSFYQFLSSRIRKLFFCSCSTKEIRKLS